MISYILGMILNTIRIYNPDYDSDPAGLRSGSRGGGLHYLTDCLVRMCYVMQMQLKHK